MLKIWPKKLNMSKATQSTMHNHFPSATTKNMTCCVPMLSIIYCYMKICGDVLVRVNKLFALVLDDLLEEIQD